MRDGDIVRVDLRRGSLHVEDTLMTTDAVRVDLVKFGGKTGMFPFTLERKDIDARHHGMAGCMAFRAVNLRMHGRLFPKRRFPLLLMAGNTELLMRRRIAGQGDGCIHTQDDQNAPYTPSPKRKMWKSELHYVPV